MLNNDYRLNPNETVYALETTNGGDVWQEYFVDSASAIGEAKKFWKSRTNEERKRGADACVLAVTTASLDADLATDEDEIGTLGTYHPDLCHWIYRARSNEHWDESTGKLLPEVEYSVIEVTEDGLSHTVNVYNDLDEAKEEAEWHCRNAADPGSRVYVRAEHWRDGEIACYAFDRVLKAKIQYEADHNGKEGYAIKVNGADGEWGLDSFYPLVRREGANPDEERNFIHFGIVNKIAQLLDLGYSVTFR